MRAQGDLPARLLSLLNPTEPEGPVEGRLPPRLQSNSPAARSARQQWLAAVSTVVDDAEMAERIELLQLLLLLRYLPLHAQVASTLTTTQPTLTSPHPTPTSRSIPTLPVPTPNPIAAPEMLDLPTTCYLLLATYRLLLNTDY